MTELEASKHGVDEIVIENPVSCTSYQPRGAREFTREELAANHFQILQSCSIVNQSLEDTKHYSNNISFSSLASYGTMEERHALPSQGGNHHRKLRRAPTMDMVHSMMDSVKLMSQEYHDWMDGNPKLFTTLSSSSPSPLLTLLEESTLVNSSEDGSQEVEEAAKRCPDRTTSTLMAGWNVLNIIQGIGIMGIPYAYANSGWFALPITLLVGIICCFSGKLIGECLYDRLPDQTFCSNLCIASASETAHLGLIRKRNTYACIAGDVFPTLGRQIIACIVVIELLGASILYVILLGTSVNAIADYLHIPNLSITICIAVFGYATLPLLLFPTMHFIAWFSFLAVLCLTVSMGAVLVGCSLESAKTGLQWDVMLNPDSRMIPVCVGIILFSFCAHPIIPGIEGSMRRPHLFSRMLAVTFGSAIIIKLIFGGMGALVFGTNTKQAITDNLISMRGNAIFAHLFVAFNVFFSMPLIFYILGQQADYFVQRYVDWNVCHWMHCGRLYPIWVFVSRCTILSFSILTGILVPHFALIMGMIGAFTGSLLCFILPTLFHLKLFWTDLSRMQRLVRIVIFVFGIVAGATGVICSGFEIITVFSL